MSFTGRRGAYVLAPTGCGSETVCSDLFPELTPREGDRLVELIQPLVRPGG
jgi:hypothetical protein